VNPFSEFRAWFIWLTSLFVNWAMFWYGQIWPLSYLGDVFRLMSDWSAAIATTCYDAIGPWATFTSDLANIWYWVNRLAWLDTLRDMILNAGYWVANWWNNVLNVVVNWWWGVWPNVLATINAAVAPFAAVKTAWDNFWTYILPGLLTWTTVSSWWSGRLAEVQALINTALAAAAPFWAGWVEVRDQVLEFFADPLEWLWGRFADWFLGPE